MTIAEEFFHDDSDSVRFWVQVAAVVVGASVSKRTLHFRFAPQSTGEDPLTTFRAHRAALEAAVRRRVARGSIEPVMIREADLRVDRDVEDNPA
jgi:hypothetical protein